MRNRPNAGGIRLRRSVTREQAWEIELPDQSAMELAGRLVASGTSPSGHLVREELRIRLRATLALLSPQDRQVLVLGFDV